MNNEPFFPSCEFHMLLFIHIFIEKIDLSFVFIFPNETIKRKKKTYPEWPQLFDRFS